MASTHHSFNLVDLVDLVSTITRQGSMDTTFHNQVNLVIISPSWECVVTSFSSQVDLVIILSSNQVDLVIILSSYHWMVKIFTGTMEGEMVVESLLSYHSLVRIFTGTMEGWVVVESLLKPSPSVYL